MSGHYCCKDCGQRFDNCRCNYTPGVSPLTNFGQKTVGDGVIMSGVRKGSAMHKSLKEGDQVSKQGGDYSFDGWVVGIITKRSGEVRYIVEDERGLLFIFNRKNLVFMARPAKGKKK